MASVVAGAGLGAIGGLISSGIQSDAQQKVANTNATAARDVANISAQGGISIANIQANSNANVANIRAQNNLELQTSINKGLTNLEYIKGNYMLDNTYMQTYNQRILQQQQIDQSNYIRNNLLKSLEDAGLPSYLAFIQPDESMMVTRQVRGINFASYYPGQRYHKARY